MAKKYKCPYCDLRLIRKDLIRHINKKHPELIPQGFSSARLVYNQVNKVDCGKCRVCGKSTGWNEKSGRYDVLCGNPKCKEHMREEYKKNMLRVRGTYNILNDPEQQKKMLANRSISGTYKFSDGGVLTYTGSYEKKCLEFMDVVMQIPSKDILSPGPTLEYEYNGEKHFYITDFYYIPYNLIIEVKDGGDNLNNKDSASMKASREKTIEKERLITDRGEYNYIRLTNNNFAQLIEIFMVIKEKLLEGDNSKTYKINESVILENTHSKYDIKNQAKRIAEKVKRDEKEPTGNQNCMLCTWCMEAWFRGYNVLPRPVYSPTDKIFDFKGYEIVKSSIKISIKDKNEVKKIISIVGDGSRFYTHIKWKNGNGGHEFILININNNIYVLDAQQGLFENVESSEGSTYFKKIDYSKSYLIRMDDKEFNYKLLKYNDNSYIKYFTEDDMKHIKESVLLESQDKSKLLKNFKSKKSDIDYYTISINDRRCYGYLKNHISKNHPLWEPVHDEYSYIKSFVNGENKNHETGSGELIINKENDELIGYEIVEHLEDSSDAWLAIEIPYKKYRGYGFGTMLLNDAIQKDGCNSLYVAKDNEIAIKMYENRGFKIIKDRFDGKYWLMQLNKSSMKESCRINTYNTGFVHFYIKLFANYMQDKYKSNVNTVNIKFIHSKVSFEKIKEKIRFSNYSNDFLVRSLDTIYVIDENLYDDWYGNYNNFLRYHIAQVILSMYSYPRNERLINAICTYESGTLEEFEKAQSKEIIDAKNYRDYLNSKGINMVIHSLSNGAPILEAYRNI